MKLYTPFKYEGKGVYKYSVYVKDEEGNRKLIHFGNKNYQHYRDKLGHYSYLNHLDEKRRKSFLARSKGIRNSKGQFTYMNKNSKNFWSRNILW